MDWANERESFIAKRLGLTYRPKTNTYVHCPFHDDNNESASINFNKSVFNCFKVGCVGGLSFSKLEKRLQDMKHEKLIEAEPVQKFKVRVKKTKKNWHKIGREYLESRGINPDKIPIPWEGCNEYYKDDGKPFAFYGYLLFESVDGYVVGRDLTNTEGRPKYSNQPGEKGLFWIDRDLTNKVIYVTEGIFDALSLYELGIRNICTTLGSTLPNKSEDRIAYDLRGFTVIIIYDNDPTGFQGSKKVSSKLKEFEVDHSIIEFPKRLGRDLNEALVNNREDLAKWLAKIKDKFSPDDKEYVKRLFRGKDIEPLNILPTGIEPLDKMLTGGFKDGAHLISGTTGIGKTSLVLNLADIAAKNGKKTMINSCEISKKQTWARIGSGYSDYTWSELEENPHLLEKDAYKETERLSNYIQVVNGWPLARIMQEADNYDIIIIDYIQRVREVYGGEDSASMHAINNYMSQLSDLGALQGKICLVVSSISRETYNNPDSYGLKGSGSLEFMGASVSRLMDSGKENSGKFIWKIQKNTRGETGMVRISGVDLGHINFENVEAVRIELENV